MIADLQQNVKNRTTSETSLTDEQINAAADMVFRTAEDNAAKKEYERRQLTDEQIAELIDSSTMSAEDNAAERRQLTDEQIEGLLDQTFETGEEAVAELNRRRQLTPEEIDIEDLVAQSLVPEKDMRLTPEEIDAAVDQVFIPAEDPTEENARAFIAFRDAMRAGSPQGSTDNLGAWAYIGREMLAFYATGGTDAGLEVYDGYLRRNQEFADAIKEAERRDAPMFTPMTLDDLLKMPPKQWLIQNVVGEKDLAMVYGAPGSKKSFVMIDLIFSACLGKPFATRFNIPRKMNVAYCAGEGLSGLPQRFRAAANHYRAAQMDNFTFFKTIPRLYSERPADAHIEGIERFISEWQARQEKGEARPLDILIIDTLHSATAGADENSAKDMGMVIDAAQKAIERLGCAVVLVHHTNKGGVTYRGSTSLHGAMDTMIKLSPTGESGYSKMECDKIKDGETWDSQDLCLMKDGDSAYVWWAEPKDKKSEALSKTFGSKLKIFELLEQHGGLTRPKIEEATGESKANTNKLLNQMIEEGNVSRELAYPDRPVSSANPWIYSINPQGEGVKF